MTRRERETKMISLTNETRTARQTFWFVNVDGKPVARLHKQAKGWNRWSVWLLTGDRWAQFASRDAALAFAVA